jgi:hypothetical protein
VGTGAEGARDSAGSSEVAMEVAGSRLVPVLPRANSTFPEPGMPPRRFCSFCESTTSPEPPVITVSAW